MNLHEIIESLHGYISEIAGSIYDEMNMSGSTFGNVNAAGCFFRDVNVAGASFIYHPVASKVTEPQV